MTSVSFDKPMSIPTKVLYASGSAANGIKQRALSAFLLIYYNQVVGLSAELVSAVITIVLIFDALIDPVVGQISDNFRHRWGRRHPFIYFSAIPLGIAFFMIWNPPGGASDQVLVGYLLVCLLAIRLLDTFFELPSTALLPELVSDYDERTNLQTIRTLFNSVGGILALLLAYQVFMRESPDGSGGVIARDGYFGYGLFIGLLMTALIIISGAATHHRIPDLTKVVRSTPSIKEMLREMGQALGNRSMAALIVAGMLSMMALGIRNGLEIYFALYFWEFTQAQLSLLAIVAVAASFAGAPVAAYVARRFGKKRAVIYGAGLAIGIQAAPIAARLIGIMPENGTDLLFYIMAVDVFAHASLAMIPTVTITSMLADVVEEVELKTGRRSEGILLAADNFFKKMVSSGGILVVGVVLATVDFPKGAERGTVPDEVLTNLATLYLPLIAIMLAGYLISISFYKIDREIHNSNLAQLRERSRK